MACLDFRLRTVLALGFFGLAASGSSLACASLVGADFDHADSDPVHSSSAADAAIGKDPATAIDPVEPPVAPEPDGSCPAKRKLCDGLCVSKSDPAYGCGDTCTPCSVARGTAGCSAGACVVASCEDKRADCNTKVADGCETALRSDPAHCGACGNVCGNGLVCSNGSCASTCTGGETACGGACVDTSSSPEHCGGCDDACPPKENAAATCEGGQCGFQCNAGFRKCGGICKAEGINACGATCAVCEAPANAVATCTNGGCGYVCNTGFTADGLGGCATDPTLERVAVTRNHACAIRTDGTVVTFGDTFRLTTGPFRQAMCSYVYDGNALMPRLSLGAVQTNGIGVQSVNGVANNVAGGTPVLMVRAEPFYSCALKADGTIACTGSIASPPAGTFRHLATSEDYACAVRTDGSLACWGSNAYQQATPPPGTFRQVSTGYGRACAVRTDGTVACWGAELVPPAGKFHQVAVGANGAVGLHPDGTLEGWGEFTTGSITPPSGTFRQVAVGNQRACAIRTNGKLACWGESIAVPTETFW